MKRLNHHDIPNGASLRQFVPPIRGPNLPPVHKPLKLRFSINSKL